MIISNRWRIQRWLDENCSKLFSCLRGRNELFRQNLVLLGKFLKDWVPPVLWLCIIFTPHICASLQHQEINSILCKIKDTSQSHRKALQCVTCYLWVLLSAGAVPHSCDMVGRQRFQLLLSFKPCNNYKLEVTVCHTFAATHHCIPCPLSASPTVVFVTIPLVLSQPSSLKQTMCLL